MPPLLQVILMESKRAYLDWICVIKSIRNQGVAQKLLESLESKLREIGIKTLIALTALNEEAQHFIKAFQILK